LRSMKRKQQINPLPYPVYFWVVILLAAAGLADSIYLAVSHYRVYTDIAYSSFCAISKAINCDTVSQSVYSILLGVPIPVWGIIGYTFILLILLFACKKEVKRQQLWPIIFSVSLAFSIYSVILAVISVFYIHSYCIMCVVSYGINFLLLYYSWIIRKRFDNTELIEGLKLDVKFLWKLRKKVLSVFLPALGFCLILLIFFPSYWNFSSTLLPKDMLDGITKEGYPWIGASNPELEIMEFTDYQCFQCKKMHFFLRQLIAKHPGKIRLIHRHFPMDHKLNPIVKDRFHVGSSTMALFSAYAQTQGKFWEMNDVLYSMAGKKKVINIKDLAEKIGLNYRELFYSTKDRDIRYKVKHDISTGIKLGINGTPAYVINSKVYFANIPQQILKKVLEY
jgi:uncharacterized membrane protein/predicted DsbA family dithiol-disulfide isomerase